MKVLKFLDAKLEEYLMTVLTIVMTALIFLQVVMRYIFKDSPAWTEELSRYLFLWAIWIGASYGVKTQSHVRLTVLTSRLSKKVQDVINVVVWFLWLAFTIFLVTKALSSSASSWPPARPPPPCTSPCGSLTPPCRWAAP